MSTFRELGAVESEISKPSMSQESNNHKVMEDATCKENEGDDRDIKGQRGWRFWGSFAALSISSLLARSRSPVSTSPHEWRYPRLTPSLAVSTAMSTIVHDLNIGSSYPWAINAFLLTSTCFQPTWGQLAELFGRGWITLLAVAIYVLGSGVSRGAAKESTFLVGRALQGTGGGGINMLD